ncbi:MAG: cytochrome B [Porticoccaceae bacterium]|nr:MAG: cytochrome B [Porticoccaceae bacterium]
MSWKNTTERFGLISIGFHWLMFLLLVAVYACIEFRELYPKGSDPREALKSWHFMLGLTVFILVWLRLLARLLQINPKSLSPSTTWQTFAAKMTHFTLYLLMLSMPLMGWLILSAEGKLIPFYGMALPSLVAENHDLAEFIEEIHETVGTLGYFLIALHTLAALFHHYRLKDGTLMRILSINRH